MMLRQGQKAAFQAMCAHKTHQPQSPPTIFSAKSVPAGTEGKENEHGKPVAASTVR